MMYLSLSPFHFVCRSICIQVCLVVFNNFIKYLRVQIPGAGCVMIACSLTSYYLHLTYTCSARCLCLWVYNTLAFVIQALLD